MGKKLSVVVPIFNEEAGIENFLTEQLIPVLDSLDFTTEVVLVNDGSTDRTVGKLEKMVDGKKLRLVSLTRNFGKEVALSVGLKYAEGDAVIMIDADGQHPVEMIPKMLEKWEMERRL